ncbi:uracil phosphoribosyltransferase-domain-containing protein [Tricladium varicosporioides]|nr:uracil phosphoribosyltransferase-domain-containing protein [Hymenoscyphus varicosporioides]
MSSLTVEPQPNQSTTPGSRPGSSSSNNNNKNPIVIGLYGIPGSGKSFLLARLREQEHEKEHFKFYEGSKMIANLVPGGLDAFQKLEGQEKVHWRQLAIDTIKKECVDSGRVAVVAGHFMFWPEEEETGQPQAEKTQLRHLCRHHGILFSLISPQPAPLGKISTLLRDFQYHTEEYNLSRAESKMDEVVGQGQRETVLVMDADRTLAAEDTGELFWKRALRFRRPGDEGDPLKTLFSGPLGYSYTAFRQATLLYEEAADDQEFDALCQDVASEVTMHSEFVSLLHRVADQAHVGAVVITCGLRRVWEKVLERERLSETVKVIGGGRISDGFIITAAVKAALVARLQAHQTYVWAFGDSPLDLEMLSKADQAVVVVGEEHTRSRAMDGALMNAIRKGGLRARQTVLPSNASLRLDTTELPLIQLTDYGFIDSLICNRSRYTSIQVLHAADNNVAKLLMTPMRDAKVAGPALREAHRRVGWYLATEFLPGLVGTEEYLISHVQGHNTSGYRLFHEQQTLIVALMRGGEPMALGVNEAFPLATFLHAHCPNDIMPHHLQGQHTIVLVDSVVNSGRTVVQFLQHIRNLHASVRVVVVAGVVQTNAISGSNFTTQVSTYPTEFSLVALRLSENKFSGRGTTDTGNRLFNTTLLP